MSVDRIALAVELAAGRRVLDIGGQKMPQCAPDSPFAKAYGKIAKAAREYRIVDYQKVTGVDYCLDLNQAGGVRQLRESIDEYRPEAILCMETLEHVNYHFECMNEMARAIERYGSTVYVTVPNNANWIFNILGWNRDHSIAFFKDIAMRFVSRSDLGRFDIAMHGCMQKYVGYWWIAYALAFFQPFSWGFVIRPKGVGGKA
jgi:hypothetical protein